MKTLSKTLALCCVLSLSLVACGDDDGGGGGDDEFPALGQTLDRMGRSAVATALIESFLFADGTSQTDAKNAYSVDDDVAGWAGRYSDEIAKNIAIVDSLDGTCGNSFLFAGGGGGAYGPLADALANDRLVINAANASCGQYLGAEAGAADCGGRSPVVDSIEATYSALAVGDVVGVTSGITADDATHSDSAFPYLAAPL